MGLYKTPYRVKRSWTSIAPVYTRRDAGARPALRARQAFEGASRQPQGAGRRLSQSAAKSEGFKPFGALSSDITYIPTDEGYDYLCQVKDIAAGAVLAACQQEHLTRQLVIDTFRAAHKHRRFPNGGIFHSDRGSQYTSKKVMRLLAKLGVRQSFSRVSMPGDNAWSESFFSILKKEALHPFRFQCHTQARQAIYAYIETFYNRSRIQKKLYFRSLIKALCAAHLLPPDHCLRNRPFFS